MDYILPTRWPLVPIDAAAFYLNRRPEEVARACDSVWAWDISSDGSRRRQLRIWRNSLIALKNPVERRNIPGRIDQVIDSFLPHRSLKGRELQDVLFCTAYHIRNLADLGLLTVERRGRFMSGPNSSPVYSRQSVKEFLNRSSLAAMVAPGLHPASRN